MFHVGDLQEKIERFLKKKRRVGKGHEIDKSRRIEKRGGGEYWKSVHSILEESV